MSKQLNAYELAKRLKVSHTTVYRWVEQGMPVEKKRSGLRTISRFNIEDVRKWIKENRVGV